MAKAKGKSRASEVAKREGKKKQVSIGNIREVQKIDLDIFAEELSVGGDSTPSPHFNAFLEDLAKRIAKIRKRKAIKITFYLFDGPALRTKKKK